MKYIIIIFILSLSLNTYSQDVYYATWIDNLDTTIVQITIDAEKSSPDLVVTKESTTSPTGTSLNPTDIILYGGFDMSTNDIPLEYDDYNYYWVPFDPSTAIYHINSFFLTTSDTAKFHINAAEDTLGIHDDPGDWTYWCSCGGGPHDSGPGGCVSSMDPIRCVDDSGCSSACIGEVFTLTTIPGNNSGGVIIRLDDAHSFFHTIDLD